MAIRRLFALMAAIGLILVAAIPVAANDRNRYSVNVLATGPSPDADLVNGWGISRLPTSPWWVADNGTDLSTLYKADGTKQGLRVAIPMGAPTGTVSSTNAADFHGDLFLFSSEAGVISGWRRRAGDDRRGRQRRPRRRRRLQGPRNRDGRRGQGHGDLSLRDRLPQRPDRRLRQLVRVADVAGRLHRPEAARRATPRSASRTSRA